MGSCHGFCRSATGPQEMFARTGVAGVRGVGTVIGFQSLGAGGDKAPYLWAASISFTNRSNK